MPELSWRGRHKLKALREHGGRSAVATVLEFDKGWGVPESGYGGIPMGHSEHYTLKIRVEPVGEPAFDAEIKEHDYFVTDFGRPRPGDHFAVVYNPNDHAEVVRDPLDAESVVPPTLGALKLKPDEEDRFRQTLFANLEKLRQSGKLNEQQYQQKRAQLDAEFEPVRPVAVEPARDLAAQLTDLEALRDRGVLSDAEFQAQKAKLLGEA
jgi:Short C-terminal domain